MKKVLIVDDDYAMAQSFASYLKVEGLEVQVAHSLEQAVKTLQNAGKPFDVALIDIILPESPDSIGLQFVPGSVLTFDTAGGD